MKDDWALATRLKSDVTTARLLLGMFDICKGTFPEPDAYDTGCGYSLVLSSNLSPNYGT
jgi:hypothetical protein